MTSFPVAQEFQLQEQTQVDENANMATYQKLEGFVEIKNLTFGHNRLEPPLFENLNFTLQPGKSVALVGTTGCGKSTLVALIAGLLMPWDGDILFDGHLRSTLPGPQLKSSLAMVEQSTYLFQGTIKDNLSLYSTNISEKDLDTATKEAIILKSMTMAQT